MSFTTDAALEIPTMKWFIDLMKSQGHNFQYLSKTNEYSPYDGVLLKGKWTGVVEVKVRKNWTYDKLYEFTTGQMLEMKKLLGMEKEVAGTVLEGCEKMYFIFYSDGLAVWKLKTSSEYEWFHSMYPRNNQGGEMIDKATVDLPRADAFYPYKQQ